MKPAITPDSTLVRVAHLSGSSVGQLMDNLRTWLDHQGSNPWDSTLAHSILAPSSSTLKSAMPSRLRCYKRTSPAYRRVGRTSAGGLAGHVLPRSVPPHLIAFRQRR